MTLEEAINASQYREAIAHCNNLWCTVDGNTVDFDYAISIGVEGMPTHDYEQARSLEAAIEIVKEKGWLDEDRQPVEEDD